MTAVVDASAAVLERYQYSAYGEVTFLEADFDVASSQASAIGNQHLYTGRERDPETGLQLNRHRYYEPPLGRWNSRDPISYDGSPWNLYEYGNGAATTALDPSGKLVPTPPPPPPLIGALCTPLGAATCIGAGGGVIVYECCTKKLLEDQCTELICHYWYRHCDDLDDHEKGKWKCTTKARYWAVGSRCYGEIFDGFGQTEQEAKRNSWNACVDWGCHKPGKGGGQCGHTTCRRLP